MNLLYPYSWIKKFLITDISANDFSKYVSLCGSSVERLKKDGDDYIFDTEITTNRWDLMSIRGFAKDANAILSYHGKKTSLNLLSPKTPALSKSTKLKIKAILDFKICPKFCAVIMDNIKVGESPAHIKNRLIKVGQRPLNSIIDVTNYIYHEFGQPMHAFDFDKIAKGANTAVMRTRSSKKGESLITLDGQKRALPEGSIIIDDTKTIYDLAGIMGGKNSAVDKNTKRIILFTQIYDKKAIRKTSLLLNHRTLAAQLFEKGIDPLNVLPALYRGIELVKKYSKGQIASNIYNIDHTNYKPRKTSLSHKKLITYLGQDLKPRATVKILESLGFKTIYNPIQKVYTCQVPSWRYDDINIEEDLIEEIIRIIGYFNLQPELVTKSPPQIIIDKRYSLENAIKYFLKFNGFSEAYTYSLVDKDQKEDGSAIYIKNPLTNDKKVLRNLSVLPNLISQVIQPNKGVFNQIKVFEMANIYLKTNKEMPLENLVLGVVAYNKTSKENYFYLKGILDAIFYYLKVYDYRYQESNSNSSWLKYFKEIFITLNTKKGVEIAVIGKLDTNLWGFQINLDTAFTLSGGISTKDKFNPINTHVPVIEDISFIVKPLIRYQNISNTLNSINLPPEIELIYKIKDRYVDKKLKNKEEVSYTFEFKYNSLKKQLSDKDVVKIRELIIRALEKGLKAKMRMKR